MRFTIVSAADAGYFGLLQGLVLSCRDQARGREVPIHVLDLGLSQGQRAWLAELGVECAEPGWDYDFPGRAEAPATFRAQTARPFLPRYFPGYDTYLWMDADTWIQDWGAVETYVAAAGGGRMAISPEVDRCYSCTFDTGHALGQFESYRSVYGEQTARMCGLNPTLNSGVFALAADAPHWEMWAEELGAALQKTRSFYIEQFALNYVLYVRKPPVYFLAARYNWITWYATPLLRAGSGLFVEPRAPFSPLGVLHLTGTVKASEQRVVLSDGSEAVQSLEYPRRTAPGTAPPPPALACA
jgi:lipopolysaccharide biosynthesis glycosyltransferase